MHERFLAQDGTQIIIGDPAPVAVTVTRYEPLDVLRGTLALLIVLQHLIYLSTGHETWWGHLQLPVNTFIVLSGFFSTMLLTSRDVGYWRFVSRRVCKLYPAYFWALVLSLVIRSYIHLPIEAERMALERAHFPLYFASHLLLLQGLIPSALLPTSDMALLVPAWFVSLVFQWYLVAPLIGKLSERWRWVIFALSLAVLIRPLHWRLFVYWSSVGAFLPQKLYLFMIGNLLYTYFPRFGAGSVPRWLHSGLWLGKHSYAIYLFHYPVLQVLFSIV